MTSKEETWSRDTNSRLPFDVNGLLNLFSISSKTWDCDVLDAKTLAENQLSPERGLAAQT